MAIDIGRRSFITNSSASVVAGLWGVGPALGQDGYELVRQARDLLLPGLYGRASRDEEVKDWDIHIDKRTNSLVLKIAGYRRTAVRVITEAEIRSGEYKKMFVGLNTSMLEEIKKEK